MNKKNLYSNDLYSTESNKCLSTGCNIILKKDATAELCNDHLYKKCIIPSCRIIKKKDNKKYCFQHELYCQKCHDYIYDNSIYCQKCIELLKCPVCNISITNYLLYFKFNLCVDCINKTYYSCFGCSKYIKFGLICDECPIRKCAICLITFNSAFKGKYPKCNRCLRK